MKTTEYCQYCERDHEWHDVTTIDGPERQLVDWMDCEEERRAKELLHSQNLAMSGYVCSCDSDHY